MSSQSDGGVASAGGDRSRQSEEQGQSAAIPTHAQILLHHRDTPTGAGPSWYATVFLHSLRPYRTPSFARFYATKL